MVIEVVERLEIKKYSSRNKTLYVYYCTKFDEIHLIMKVSKYIWATYMCEETVYAHWVSITPHLWKDRLFLLGEL